MTQIDELRAWRRQAIEAHMYETAELVGDKILAWSGHPDDAYWLAQTYYGMGEYVRGAALILDNLYDQESPKCRYVAGLCLLQAQNLDRALAVLTADREFADAPDSIGGLGAAGPNGSGPPGPASASHAGHAAPAAQASRAPSHPSHPSHAAGHAASHATSHAASHAPGPPTSHHASHSAAHPSTHPLTATPASNPASNPASHPAASLGPSLGPPLADEPAVVPLPGPSRPHHKVRVVSTSSLKAPHAPGARTVSTGSRLSMILSGVDDESLPEPLPGDEPGELNGVFVDALLQHLVGRVYTMQSRFGLAKEAYIAALRIDARCYDALAQLVKHHALTAKEEYALLDSLDFSRIGGDLVASLYAQRLTAVASTAGRLAEASATLADTYLVPEANSDMVVAEGNRQFGEGRYAAARATYEQALADDRYNLRVYTNYAACLLELGAANQLYRVAHQLADAVPDTAVTWYAVGLYYMATARVAEARTHFSKASLIDPGYAPAWLAFARTFAVEGEHEQAITAFSTVARLFPGYHVPYVCIGIQHLQLSNLTLAEKYLATAADFFEEDPLIMNELGVVFYHQNKLTRALQILEFAAQLLDAHPGNPATRLSVMANRGYVLRRMGRLPEAYALFEQVSAGAALDPSVLAAMGMCLLQMGDTALACDKLALALALAPDDPVTNDLMKRAVQMASQEFSIDKFVASNEKHMKKKRVEVTFGDLPDNA